MPRLLTESQVKAGLKQLAGWKREGEFIVKAFEFPSFLKGMEFVQAVASVAEGQDHHPDIYIRYTTVTLSIQTHSSGGITRWDLELARAIDGLTSRTWPRGSGGRRSPRTE